MRVTYLHVRCGTTGEPALYGPLLSTYCPGDGDSYPHYDALGSARRLSDSMEVVSSPIDYSAWGELLTGMPADFPFLYVGVLGYYTDLEAGYIYVRARTYAAWQGRWLSPDPAGIATGDNSFEFSGNDPVRNADPAGSVDATQGYIWRASSMMFATPQIPLLFESPALSHGNLLRGDAADSENGGKQLARFDPVGRCRPWDCNITNPNLKYLCHPLVNPGARVVFNCFGHCDEARTGFPESVTDSCLSTRCYREVTWECQVFIDPGPPPPQMLPLPPAPDAERPLA